MAPAIHPHMDAQVYRPHLEALRARGATVLGGADLHAGWDEIETLIASRLGLVRKTPPAVIRLDELARRR